MNGIIYIPNKGMDELLKDTRFEFVQTGVLDSEGIRNALIEAARLNLLILFIDLAAVPGASSSLLNGLLTYRIQRPNTRIIILAQGRQPGDPLMAGLFAKGIYDLIVPDDEEDISAAINKSLFGQPATFADAARWAAQGIPSVGSARKERAEHRTKETSQQIIQTVPNIIERPIGTAAITVAGAGSGCGTSHLSLALAGQLAKAGNSVLLAEWPDNSNNNDLLGSQYAQYLSIYGAKTDNDLYSCGGFHVFPGAYNLRSIDFVFQKAAHLKYNYLVLDLGRLYSENMREMDRASLPILVTPAAPFRYVSYLKTLAQDDIVSRPTSFSHWTLALNMSNERYSYWFKNAFDQVFDRLIDVPFFPDPLEDPPEDILLQILYPVMRGIAPKKKKGLFRR